MYEVREATTEPKPTQEHRLGGGALGILPNGLRLLHRLGLYEKLLSRGSSNSRVVIRSIDGSVLGEQDVVGWAREQTRLGQLRIKRSDVVAELLEAVQTAGITVQYGKTLTTIEEHENSITAVFADGTRDSGDILLGCDGIHSSVRRLYVDPSQISEYTGFAGLTALVASGSAAPKLAGINPTLTPEGMFTTVSCTAAEDEIYWVFSRETPLPDSLDARDGWEVRRRDEVQGFKTTLFELLADAGGEWGAILKDIVEQTSTVQFYPVYRLPLGGTWYRGRCMLLGDAAHAMQPQAGQGISMALEDAFLICKLLRDPTRSLPDVFEEFDRVRRPRVEEIASLAASNAEGRKKTGPWGYWFKQYAIWAFMGISSTLRLGKLGLGQKHMVYDIEDS